MNALQPDRTKPLYYNVNGEHSTVRCRCCDKRIEDVYIARASHARVHTRKGEAVIFRGDGIGPTRWYLPVQVPIV